MLFIFFGLVSSGKSDVAINLSERINAVYVRIGTVNPAINSKFEHCRIIDNECYSTFYKLVYDNLKLGFNVVTHLVNDTYLLHHTFSNIALSLSVPCQNVEIICSNKIQHRYRVENEFSVVPGLSSLDWKKLQYSYCVPLCKQLLQLDIAILSTAQCVEKIMVSIDNKQGHH